VLPADGAHAGRVAEHYSRPALAETVLARVEEGLRQEGRDPSTLTFRDLSQFDQLHSRGPKATMQLAERVGVHDGMHVLDVGGGMGGPARMLAGEFGCRVTALDLTEDFTRAGQTLTERVGLSHLLSFRTGNALDMPFEDNSFDLVWAQHSVMNIADRERLYGEMHRVLRPGGRLALHDMAQGSGGQVHYPVLWAPTPEISFLLTPEATRALIVAAGFREVSWVDATILTAEWFRKTMEAASAANSALADPRAARSMAARASVLRNLEEGRLACIEAVFEKV
jgi:ubiquinone/menaquinone biosynthesis C-methylase UbiE